MRNIFRTSTPEGALDLVVLLLRITVAAFMLTHGLPKLERLIGGGEIQFADPFGLGPVVSLGLTVFAEFLCSILVGIGLGTRLAVVPLMVTMAVAAFISHGNDPFARKEMALLYLIIYITLLVTGSRKYSMDRLLFRRFT
jgi:putative oxidoreductase